VAQLEFTQLAQYAGACHPAKTVLVEHDITLDLYRQLLTTTPNWETEQQLERWVRFEEAAWRQVDAVVTMSDKDRRTVGLESAITLVNGVDLSRFQPSTGEPEPGRLLFIGSFAHLPNVLAVDFFLRQVWPAVRERAPHAVLHLITGSRPEYFLDLYKDRVQPPLTQPGIEWEGFVSDPRPAYHRASVVIAPLLASAGTNIKIMEAMAMGRAIVSTRAGINGLDDLAADRDLLVSDDPAGFADAVNRLLSDADLRRSIEKSARATVAARYGWEAVGARQRDLYRRLMAASSSSSAPAKK
jgi:glycosyltransferase involved in cell wall biosynthesis